MQKHSFIFTFFLLIFAISTSISAQNSEKCASDVVLKKQLAADPKFRLNRDTIEQFTKQFESNQQNGANRNQLATVTIPVVFHVVYKTTDENVSDTKLNDQIARLNADYGGTNVDVSQIPAAFQGVKAGNTNIQFCLAQQDPSGNATTGIIRVPTTVSSFSDDDAVKSSTTGGSNPWNTSKYLNIWVCNITGGILGYATPPGGPSAKDGVVIGYKYFGDGSPGGVYNKGRTATHEVGHWLGLNHTWGDDDFAGEPQCGGSDGVDDTPNQEDATYGAPSFPKLDDCSPVAPGIMFMNYMDYVDDGSMNMFTNDQADEMRAVLEGSRASILESVGCVQGGDDISGILKAQLISLTTYPNPGVDVIVCELKNFEGNTVTVDVYDITGNLIDRMIVANSGDEKMELQVADLPGGTYLIKATDGQFTLTQQITVVK
jgi:hypothetical protein